MGFLFARGGCLFAWDWNRIETCGRCTRTAAVKGHGMDERRQAILGAGVESEWVDKPFGGHGDVYRWLRANYAFVVNWIAKQKAVLGNDRCENGEGRNYWSKRQATGGTLREAGVEAGLKGCGGGA